MNFVLKKMDFILNMMGSFHTGRPRAPGRLHFWSLLYIKADSSIENDSLMTLQWKMKILLLKNDA